MKCIEDEIPFELPDGWEWCRIYTVAQDLPYGTAKKSSPTGDVIVLRMGNIQNGEVDYTSLVYTSDSSDIEKYNLVKGDLLFNRTNSAEWVGKTSIYRGEFPAIYAGYIIRLRTSLNPEYLNAVMNSSYAYQYCRQVKTDGVNQSNINAQKLGVFLIPVAPYAEQERIAYKIQMALPVVNGINKDVISTGEYIQKAKAKVLELAIKGKLVPQSENDEPASALLERLYSEKEQKIKAGKSKQRISESFIFRGDDNSYYEQFADGSQKSIEEDMLFELPDTWAWTRLGNISKLIQYGLSNSAEPQGEYRLLRITDIQGGNVAWDSVPFTNSDNPNDYLLQKDDIVFARTGATVGKSFLLDNIPYPSVFASYLIRIRLYDNLLPEYVYSFFNSPYYWSQITDKAVGVGQPNCNGTSLKELYIPIPPIEEQQRIVSQIRRLFLHLDEIQEALS